MINDSGISGIHANSPLMPVDFESNSALTWLHITNWVDTHANLPSRARWIAKADVVPSWSNKPGNVDPPL